jgi:PilZ domain
MSSPHKSAAEAAAVKGKSEHEAAPAKRSKARAPAPGGESGRFDKAFPVWLDGDRGVMSGVGRNITESGMFVETREPLPLGSRVKITFAGPSSPTEMQLEAEVRYQCFINFAKEGGARAGMRGMGLKFVAGNRAVERRGTVH